MMVIFLIIQEHRAIIYQLKDVKRNIVVLLTSYGEGYIFIV